MFVKNNEQKLFNTAATEAALPVVTNKRLAKKFKRKIWEIICSQKALKSSEIFLGNKEATHISRGIHRRNGVGSNLVLLVDIDALHGQEVKDKAEL